MNERPRNERTPTTEVTDALDAAFEFWTWFIFNLLESEHDASLDAVIRRLTTEEYPQEKDLSTLNYFFDVIVCGTSYNPIANADEYADKLLARMGRNDLLDLLDRMLVVVEYSAQALREKDMSIAWTYAVDAAIHSAFLIPQMYSYGERSRIKTNASKAAKARHKESFRIRELIRKRIEEKGVLSSKESSAKVAEGLIELFAKDGADPPFRIVYDEVLKARKSYKNPA
jgi:hypothetical protein